MVLAAVCARRLPQAAQAYREAGADEVQAVADLRSLEAAITAGRPAVTDDPSLLCRAEGIDVVIEVTGAVELGARVVLDAIEHGKHTILMKAELDGTPGPILRVHA